MRPGLLILLSPLVLLALVCTGCETPPKFVPDWVMEHPEYGKTERLDRQIESKYRDYLNSLRGTKGVESDPNATRQQLIARIRRKYAKEAERTLYSVIVGQPPYENKVGYVEKIAYPQVMIYDRDMGRYDPIKLVMHYIYDLMLEEPRGFVSETGLTVRFKRKNEVGDSTLGHFSPGVGAVYILGVCPSSGVVLNPDWLFNQVRTDIDRDELNRIKEITSRHITELHEYYRTVKNLDPSFHKSVQGFLVLEDKRKDFGYRNVIPVRLLELKSRDFHKKGYEDRAALKKPDAPSRDGSEE